MESYRVRWTENGKKHVSAVAYGPRSVKIYVEELEKRGGVSGIETFPVKPGE
ncbi:hypothetical protein [Streptomyces werraensis]|uniref:hypothetical protein n=1 Tax=Streptomyces werraensis TaxID=68284 RepID=UPI0036F910CC